MIQARDYQALVNMVKNLGKYGEFLDWLRT